MDIEERHLPIIKEALSLFVKIDIASPKDFYKKYPKSDVDEAFAILSENSPIRYTGYVYEPLDVTTIKAQLEGRYYDSLFEKQRGQKELHGLEKKNLKWQPIGVKASMAFSAMALIISLITLVKSCG